MAINRGDLFCRNGHGSHLCGKLWFIDLNQQERFLSWLRSSLISWRHALPAWDAVLEVNTDLVCELLIYMSKSWIHIKNFVDYYNRLTCSSLLRVSFRIVPELLRSPTSDPLNSPVPNKRRIACRSLQNLFTSLAFLSARARKPCLYNTCVHEVDAEI